MSKTFLYKETVQVTEELHQFLKNEMIQTNQLCLHAVNLLEKNSMLTVSQIKREIKNYIKQNNIKVYFISALYNALYMTQKRFQQNRSMNLSVGKIHFLTLIVNKYQNRLFTVNETTKQIKFSDHAGYLTYPGTLPNLTDNESIYWNMSYSPLLDQFQLTLHSFQEKK